MSDILTYGDCKASDELARVSGVCGDSDKFRSYLNQATRKLMQRGSFWSTVRKMQGCVYGNCITWPRRVGTVLAVDACCRAVQLKNSWYSFMPIDGGSIASYHRGECGRLTMVDGDTSPVFNQVTCNTQVYLRFYPSLTTDVGKTITVFGTDNNGLTLRSERGGMWQDGIVVTLALPYVQTTFLVRNVSRIIKQTTNGPVYAYQFDSINNVLLDLAHYESSETSPNYRTSTVRGMRHCSSASCSSRIDALVKLEFVPVVNDDDIVGIDNIEALALAFQSLRDKDAHDMVSAEINFKLALKELNMELRNKLPDSQIPVNISPYGTAHLRKQAIGYLT